MEIFLTAGSLLIALAAAFYAFQQAKAAQESVIKAEEAVRQALTQNRISALIVLKEYFEKELPKIIEMADHFATPETITERQDLDAEHMETRRMLHEVNAEIL